MNKSEFIQAVSDKSGLTKKQAEHAVNAYHEVIGDELAAGNKVQLTGFGTFERGQRAAREGRNPHTSEPLMIPATKNARFKQGSKLKDKLNQ